MIAFELDSTRLFMKHLLLDETFDPFLVSEVSITTFATFQIDGRLHPEFYQDDTDQPEQTASEELIRWASVRQHCLALIRGKHTPLAFQVIFRLPAKETAALLTREGLSVDPADVHGLFLNCRFHEGRLLLTSGCSLAVFDAGKAVERAWDAQLSRLLDQISS